MNDSKLLSIITLGITKQQSLAALVLGALLLPITAPVVALGSATNAGTDPLATESVSLWDNAITSVSNTIEALTTPWRPENVAADIRDDAKKAGNKPITVDEKLAAPKPAAPVAKTRSQADVHELPPKSPANDKRSTNPVAPVMPSFDIPLPVGEHDSLYSYSNNLGSPRGQVEADSSNRAAATSIRHRAGIADFSFDVPFASLSGRGLDASVGMTYNSRTWNKSCAAYSGGTCSDNHFTYDVEQSWIAPGFTSGFGYLEVSVNSGYPAVPVGITDSDGTRHAVSCAIWQFGGCGYYQTTDGSMTRVYQQQYGVFRVVYSGGAKAFYSSSATTGTIRKYLPYFIQDRNGNRNSIVYKDTSGRIDYIRDTLNRQIKFYYENDINNNPDKLVAITIPGMTDGSEIQTVRFYYDTLTFPPDWSGTFTGTVTAPATTRVLSYVYMPAQKTGFKYEYDTHYGMIRKISRYVGMTASTNLTNVTGSISDPGLWAASTEYNYPDGSTPLTDVPKYTKRTDNWQGRLGPAQETLYDAPEPASGADRRSTITVNDNGSDIETETISGYDGYLKSTSVSKVVGGETALMSKTEYAWNSITRNLASIKVTNDAGLVKETQFEYDSYNNQIKARECDFGITGTACTDSTALRRTETTYETGTGWIGANLLSLPKIVKTVVGGVTVARTDLEYDHNGNDAGLVRRSDMDISTQDIYYNPDHPAWIERVCPGDVPPEGTQQGGDQKGGQTDSDSGGCVNVPHPGYDASSAYRGNVTKVTRYSDATLPTDPNADVSDFEYDIAGNQVSATLSCCNLKTMSYGTTWSETGYTYPVSETKGSGTPQLTTSYGYNLNTGELIWSRDPNLQGTTLKTDYEYESDTLRPKKTIFPNGGVVETFYSDKEQSGTDLLPGYVRQTTTLDSSSHITQSYSYFDARGLGLRSASQIPDGWLISAAEYDNLGRMRKSYNPFYGSTPVVPIPSVTKYSEVTGLDALSRTTEVMLQDATTVHTYPDESTVTYTAPNSQSITGISTRIMDQAGKERRQIVDSLGRIVRVDEPTPSGLGSVSTPNQPTYYEYDGNGNLTKVIQSDGTTTQNRLFKYDSLSRLIAEKQVEANATLNDAGAKVSSGGLWTKVLKYSSHGLLTDGYDAEGVHTQMAYDSLNRVSSRTYSGETGYQTPAVTYTYDQSRPGSFNAGALTRVETVPNGDTPATATEFDYDAMGLVSKHRQWIGIQEYDLEYGYNVGGQLTSEKYPSGRIVTNTFDANGRLASIADASRTYLNGLVYQGDGGALSSMAYGNGTVQTLGLNDRMQMTSQELKRGSETLQKYNYGYGQLNGSGVLDQTKNNGQLSQIESFIGASKQWTQKFSYDQLGRLAQSAEYKGSDDSLTYKQVFDFDRFGNMYRKSVNNATTGQANPLPYTPIEDSDISKATNRIISNTAYDDGGNVVTDMKFRDVNYQYDANGRMVGNTCAGAVCATSENENGDPLSVYDAAGMRVAERTDGIWQFRVYDIGGKLVADYGGVQSADEGGVKYLVSDWQGSTRAAVSSTGYIQARMDYSAYGEDIDSGTGMRTGAQGFGISTGLRQKYGLSERDASTGLDHMWFRKNENRAGRWTSPDPYRGSMTINDPQSFNRYSYVSAQPTNFVDPSGLAQGAPRPGCYFDNAHEKWVCPPLEIPWGGHTTWDDRDPGFLHDWDFGVGGGGDTPTPAMCDAIRELLKREKQLGTMEAARVSSIEFGGKTRLLGLQNELNGIVSVNGYPLDVDWLVTLKSQLSSVSNGLPFYAGSPSVTYIIGKTFWSVGKFLSGRESQNPVPLQEAGERNALWYTQNRTKFSQIFTKSWRNENCSAKEAVGGRG